MNESLIKVKISADGEKYVSCKKLADGDAFCSIHKGETSCSLDCPIMKQVIEQVHEYEVELCNAGSNYSPLTEKIRLADGSFATRCKYENTKGIHLALIMTLNAFEAL